MDFNIYVLGLVVTLLLSLLGLLKKDTVWAVFSAFAGIIGLFFTTAILADGDLTQVSGTSTIVIASASTDTASIWQMVSILPEVFTLTAFLITIYKVATAFR